MKVSHLFENDMEQQATPATGRITPEEMEQVYKVIRYGDLTSQDIKEIAKGMGEGEEYGRSKGSAEFLITRMYILVHGIAPDGVTQNRADLLFNPTREMAEFVQSKGHDVNVNLEKAKKELAARPRKRNREQAKQEMLSFWNATKDVYSPQAKKAISNAREDIMKDIQAGTDPEAAFKKVVGQ